MSTKSIPQQVKQKIYDLNQLNFDKLVVKEPDLLVSIENFEDSTIDVPAPYFFDEDGFLCINMESDPYAGDYYGEFHDGSPHIEQTLVDWVLDHSGYWEWVNPGAIRFMK